MTFPDNDWGTRNKSWIGKQPGGAEFADGPHKRVKIQYLVQGSDLLDRLCGGPDSEQEIHK